MTAGSLRGFDPERFGELRRALGLGWGSPLHYSRETGSTNDDALNAARAGAESGSLFVTDHQTRGRGRRGKHWIAGPSQHLLFSLLLRPPSGSTPSSALTLAVGLGVRAALAAHCPAPLVVKWPNDVLAGSRKLAGILCEGQFEDGRAQALVLGVGINVGRAEYPPELAPSVTCLEQLALEPGGLEAPSREPLSVERERVLADVLAAVEARVTRCLAEGFAGLLAEFTQHDGLAGEQVELSGASPLVGRARGVDAEGRLLVETDGLLVPVHAGSVRVLPR